MRKRIRLEKSHFQQRDSDDVAIKPYAQWLGVNRNCYDQFRRWLIDGGYGESALAMYSVSARLAFGLVDKAYWQLDHQTDLAVVYQYIDTNYASSGTRTSYKKGLGKLAEYLALRNRQPFKPKQVNWAYYLGSLPDGLQRQIRAYITHCRRSWHPEMRHQSTVTTLSHLTLFLRWLAQDGNLRQIEEITPARWYTYVDERLANGIKPLTLNGELQALQPFLQFLTSEGYAVSTKMLQVKGFKTPTTLPRDVPLAQLRSLRAEIERDAQADQAGIRRMGVMDRAWFLLMLHSGLRTGEVRQLQQSQVQLKQRRVRLDQAKGLKDRLVPLSPQAVKALEAYLPLRGAANSDHVFLFRHQPLSVSYCLQRLTTYSRRAGCKVTPHQLRHSCATLLLNAGAPILTVRTILGHKLINTTLGYARLYDGTVATDYYQAMAQIEPQLSLEASSSATAITPAHLLAALDSLRQSTLTDQQKQTIQQVRAGIVSLTHQAANSTDLVTAPITNTPEGTDG